MIDSDECMKINTRQHSRDKHFNTDPKELHDYTHTEDNSTTCPDDTRYDLFKYKGALWADKNK